MVLEAICVIGDYLCIAPPLNFHIWIVEGQGQSADSREGKGEAIDFSEGQGHIIMYGRACPFEGQGWSSDHPVLIPFTLSF